MSTPEIQEVCMLPETAVWSVNYNSIIDEISPYLNFCISDGAPHDLAAITEEVMDSFSNPPGPMDDQVAINESHDLLENAAATYVDDFRSNAASVLSTAYTDPPPQ